MRSVWVDEGNDADYVTCKRNGCDTLSFAIRDPRTPNNLKTAKAQGWATRVYAAWTWWPDLSGDEFVGAVSALLTRVAPGTVGTPGVDLNYEGDNPAYVAAMLERWRELRPHRDTLWTMQSHKAALYGGIASVLSDARITVAPQCYSGAMVRVESAAEYAAWRVIASRISPFYDAAQLGLWWEGTAFTQGRLP